MQGIEIYAGLGPELKPATGNDWTIGVDFSPAFLPGLSSNVTYFGNLYKGGVTSPNPSGDVLSPALQGLIVPCPTGCTASDIATSRIRGRRRVTGSLPNTAYFFIYYDQRKVINMNLQGFDLSASYTFDTDFGSFQIGDTATIFTHWQENYGGGPNFNVLEFMKASTRHSPQGRSSPGRIWAGRQTPWRSICSLISPAAIATGPRPRSHPSSPTPTAFRSAVATWSSPMSRWTASVNGYNFTGAMLGGDQIYLDVKNMFNTRPPYFNQTQGYDYFVANPLGRTVSLGIRATF